jgi:hypothetical protein
MRFKTTHLFLAIPLFLSFQACSSSEGGKGGGLVLKEKEHITPDFLSNFEKQQWGDTVEINKNYDLYFDFSATMLRAVNDASMKEIITTAFDGLGPQDRIYSIGENNAVKEITGDKATKQNSVLGPANYTQKLTYMTPNINNIIANRNRPAIMVTDFSVDEGRPTTDADGVTSMFVRGSEYAKQFETWFSQGGSIRIYGKYISEAGKSTPVYVIAFLPAAYSESHRVNGLLSELNSKLSNDFKFDFHTHIGNATTTPNGDHLSDGSKLALNLSNKQLNNQYGELMIIAAEKIKNANSDKKLREAIEKSVFTGLSFQFDSTCFLKDATFTSTCDNMVLKSADELMAKSLDKPSVNSVFRPVTFDGQFQIGLDCKKAQQANLYGSSQLVRYHIAIDKVSKDINYNHSLAKKALQYPIGKKTIMNNCLLASIEKAMKDCANEYKSGRPVYTIFVYFRKLKK